MRRMLLALVVAVTVSAAPPPKGFTLVGVDDSLKHDFKIEKYLSEERALVWLRDGAGHTVQLWERDVNPIYPSVYVSPDEHWIVCVDKLCAGVNAAWLYKRTGDLQYLEVMPSPFSDRAWVYFRAQTHRAFEQDNRYQISTGTWFPKSHALLVELFGDDGNTLVGGWYCYYDLEKGRFYLDATLRKKNKGAVSSAARKT